MSVLEKTRKRVVYVTYEEAQKLIPIFRYYAEKGPWREVRRDAESILTELQMVRPKSYAPLSGRQIFLSESEYNFFLDVEGSLER